MEDKEYVKWLENMVILLSKCYQETHDMLLEKAKNKETNAYFSMPTIQGFSMVMNVDKISKMTKNDGNIASNKLNEYVKILIDKHNEN